jgi:serine/threonine protein kinase/DNA-binding NarL/FixJ family response regulator/tetratricopeptide (TPR) repeat protein
MSDPSSPAPSEEPDRILLVDDDATNLEVLRQALDGRGYRMFVARTGEDALDVARRSRPLLVLLDVVMPGIDGYETCRRLKEAAPAGDLGVIFLSALDDAQDKVRGFEAGAVDFITKPFKSEEVIARVRTHLGIQRVLRRQLEARSPATAAPRPAGKTPPAAPPGAGEPARAERAATGEPGGDGGVFLPGQVVACRFRIVRYIARGGMGELYEAEDLELRERVALKTILSTVAEDERSVQLFKREVHLARQVTHPNICRIFDVYRHRLATPPGAAAPPPDVLFLSMELLHGETLAERLRREGRFSGADFLLVLRQMTAGLAAAHRAGVVHRDFKSPNVMLVTPQPPETDTRAVITDFGLARRAAHEDGEGGTELSMSLTGAGEISGTPAYMAPEQVEGGPVTAAADIYALGIVMYEMLTGVRPFVADTPLRTAIKRLQEPPPPPRVHVPDVDARWEATILRCLARRPEERFASVEDVAAALEGKGGAPASGRRWRIAAGLVGLFIVALGIGAAIPRWRSPAPLKSSDTIVLADFVNSTGDAVFDDTLKQGLATGLQQSPFFNILPDRTVRETLKLMGQPADARVTGEVAQEVCQRTGSEAVIAGSISSLGSHYALGLEAVNCQTGDALARETAQAPRKEDVLASLDQAVTRLRERVGESLSTIERFDTAIAEATTPSLEALKAYSSGVIANGQRGPTAALPLYKRAIELDPEFAMAHASLGFVYVDLREYDLAAESFRKAYDRRAKVSEREKLALTAYYHANVTGELEKARQTLELWARTYPRNSTPHTNLGVIHAALGQHERALADTQESVRLNPQSGVSSAFLVANYCRLNRLQDAKATARQIVERKADRPSVHFALYGVAFLEGDGAEMERQVAWAAGKAGAEEFLLSYRADTEAFAGRLGKARELSQRAVEASRAAGGTEAAAQQQMNAALREAEFGHGERARRMTVEALAIASTANVRVMAALALARAGDAERAEQLADELHREHPLNTKINGYWLPAVRAAVETHRHHPERAVELLQAAAASELGVPDPQPGLGGMLYPVYVRGQAYLMQGRGREAAGEFQKFADHRALVLNNPLGALARLGLARAYHLQGDAARARAAYQEFFTLWAEADPDVPILRQARGEQARLK